MKILVIENPVSWNTISSEIGTIRESKDDVILVMTSREAAYLQNDYRLIITRAKRVSDHKKRVITKTPAPVSGMRIARVKLRTSPANAFFEAV